MEIEVVSLAKIDCLKLSIAFSQDAHIDCLAVGAEIVSGNVFKPHFALNGGHGMRRKFDLYYTSVSHSSFLLVEDDLLNRSITPDISGLLVLLIQHHIVVASAHAGMKTLAGSERFWLNHDGTTGEDANADASGVALEKVDMIPILVRIRIGVDDAFDSGASQLPLSINPAEVVGKLL